LRLQKQGFPLFCRKYVRPVKQSKDVVMITFDAELIQIVDLNEKSVSWKSVSVQMWVCLYNSLVRVWVRTNDKGGRERRGQVASPPYFGCLHLTSNDPKYLPTTIGEHIPLVR